LEAYFFNFVFDLAFNFAIFGFGFSRFASIVPGTWSGDVSVL